MSRRVRGVGPRLGERPPSSLRAGRRGVRRAGKGAWSPTDESVQQRQVGRRGSAGDPVGRQVLQTMAGVEGLEPSAHLSTLQVADSYSLPFHLSHSKWTCVVRELYTESLQNDLAAKITPQIGGAGRAPKAAISGASHHQGACPARCGSGPAGDVAGNAVREGEIDASKRCRMRLIDLVPKHTPSPISAISKTG